MISENEKKLVNELKNYPSAFADGSYEISRPSNKYELLRAKAKEACAIIDRLVAENERLHSRLGKSESALRGADIHLKGLSELLTYERAKEGSHD